jgi:uncharacterized membrane protein YkoI
MSRHVLVRTFIILLLGSFVGSGCSLWKKETVVTLEQTPPAVRTTIQKVTAGNTIKQIEKIEANGKITYEVEYMKEGKELDAYIAEDGKIVKGVQ